MKYRALFLIVTIFAFDAVAGEAKSLPQRVPAKAKGRINPMADSPDASRAGRKLFVRECSGCHGPNGEGIGKAPSLVFAPRSEISDGTLFWVLRNGSLWRGMPSFAHLPEPQRWQIVTYLQSLSAPVTTPD